jgi:DNA repair protein RadD
MCLRWYQQEAHDAAIDWVKKSTEPCLLELPTGSGKSHIVAAIANTLHTISNGKSILVIVPSKELVEQNAEKYRETGNPCSLFSASVGETCTRYPVVVGTPVSIKNKIHRFGNRFCAIVIDEAHRLTPTVKDIIGSIENHNPKLRIIGLSATPYRLGSGYIYHQDENGKAHGENKAKDPFFMQRVYTVKAKDLIDQGFLTQPIVGAINEHYDTINMQTNKMGQFSAADVDKAYHGHGRLTSAIVGDVVAQSRNRQGVMFFAATVQHANEIMASLPPELSAIVTGETPPAEREDILSKFKAKQIKYLVSVATLTTGFDAPHVDVIAILRATESIALLQQIIGRGLRLAPNKADCLVLDYAENIERHCPDGDIFNPEIEASMSSGGGGFIKCICPKCGQENEFSAKENKDGYQVSIDGYFLDLEGHKIETEFGAMPAHWGRRCNGWSITRTGKFEQCDERWTFKPCPHCEAENDIAARHCKKCKGEIIDPNEKLASDFKALKKDPTRLQTDRVISMVVWPTLSRAGNPCLKVEFVTEYRAFSVWFNERMRREYNRFMENTETGCVPPSTISYKKVDNFYKIIGYNEEPDEIPS